MFPGKAWEQDRKSQILYVTAPPLISSLGRKDVRHSDSLPVRKRKSLTGAKRTHATILAGCRIGGRHSLYPATPELHHPIVRNATARVHTSFLLSVLSHAAVCHFDNQENLLGARMGFGVIQWIGSTKHHVRFWLVMLVKCNRRLDANIDLGATQFMS